MLRFAVVSMDPKVLQQIADLIHRAARSRDMVVDVNIFHGPERFLFSYEPVYDMIYIDEVLPRFSVPQIVERLRKRNGIVDLIFLTDKDEPNIQVQEEGILAFIPKKPNEDRFEKEFLWAAERVIAHSLDRILLKTAEGMIRLSIRQIHYLETHNRMLHYHTTKGIYSVRKSLRSAQQELESYAFAKCNQCYLVNLGHVSDIQDNCAVVAGKHLEISRRCRKTFMDAMISHMGQS